MSEAVANVISQKEEKIEVKYTKEEEARRDLNNMRKLIKRMPWRRTALFLKCIPEVDESKKPRNACIPEHR